jgi:hypothetical protein
MIRINFDEHNQHCQYIDDISRSSLAFLYENHGGRSAMFNDLSMSIASESAIDITTSVATELDRNGVTGYIHAVNAFYANAIECTLKNGKELDFSKCYYPSTVPEEPRHRSFGCARQ